MSKIHTPLYASQPTGRRSLSDQHHVVESVLPDELVAQIRTTQFDDMLDNGFPALAFLTKTKCTTLKLTLTPSNAGDTSSSNRRCSRFHF
ncbi:hypothetical protein DSO57_1020206 [Entomophthora muscae]|uniref:Uncharacterized protein n=1 Tax=Entomophthora muscae TaxID=34485 RepID=A0ACC2SH67_9FUNG|nr:hypothetical protein DSO57_1020206 [Entomophthora muscae]